MLIVSSMVITKKHWFGSFHDQIKQSSAKYQSQMTDVTNRQEKLSCFFDLKDGAAHKN